MPVKQTIEEKWRRTSENIRKATENLKLYNQVKQSGDKGGVNLNTPLNPNRA